MPPEIEPSRMLAPSNWALVTVLLIWLRRARKSVSIALREAASSDGSWAATTLALIWLSRSETEEPAVWATSAIDEARSRLDFTAPRELTSARWPWAMAQTEALSLALAMARPVEIRSWA